MYTHWVILIVGNKLTAGYSLISDITGKGQYGGYPHSLLSLGLPTVGSQPDNAETRSERTDRVLPWNSGGYQIGTGKLNYCRKLRAVMSADAAALPPETIE